MSCTSALGAPRLVVPVRARRASRRARAPLAVSRAVSSGDAPGEAEKSHFLSRRDAVLSAAALASLAAAPSADARRFSVDVRSIFGHIFSHNKK